MAQSDKTKKELKKVTFILNFFSYTSCKDAQSKPPIASLSGCSANDFNFPLASKCRSCATSAERKEEKARAAWKRGNAARCAVASSTKGGISLSNTKRGDGAALDDEPRARTMLRRLEICDFIELR